MPYKDYEKTKAKAREYALQHPDRIRATTKKYREAHREDMEEHNSRRMFAGRIYLGMCGTTRKEREQANGETE